MIAYMFSLVKNVCGGAREYGLGRQEVHTSEELLIYILLLNFFLPLWDGSYFLLVLSGFLKKYSLKGKLKDMTESNMTIAFKTIGILHWTGLWELLNEIDETWSVFVFYHL